MSNNKMPSMVALLGLLAVAGYQNRDKIGEMIRNNGGGSDPNRNAGQVPGQTSGPASLFDEIGSVFSGSGGGSSLSEAVTGLVDRFRNAGQALVADSWVASGTNQEVKPDDLAASLGEDVVQQLTQKTGLSRTEILSRLARTLPEAVDRMTPDGRIPSATEAQAQI